LFNNTCVKVFNNHIEGTIRIYIGNWPLRTAENWFV
jgi:hypothetical protein